MNPKIPKSSVLRKEKFPDTLNIYWQPKGYFDVATCLAYANDYKAQVKRGEKLHQMDNLEGQSNPKFREILRNEAETLIAFTEPNCTDLGAACDAGLIKDIKGLVKKRFELDFEERVDDWCDGKISASEFRMLVAKWLDESWKEYFEGDGQARVVDTFKKVGLMNAFDGTEDNLVKVQGCENYSFESDSEDESESSDSSASSGEEDYMEIDEQKSDMSDE